MPPALDDIRETHQPRARDRVKNVEQKVPQKEAASAPRTKCTVYKIEW